MTCAAQAENQMTKPILPPFLDLMNPLLRALKQLGGSGTNEEIDARVADLVGLTDEQLEVLHDPARGGQTEFSNRVAWGRNYLKRYGALENSQRGVWSLTPMGRQLDSVDGKAVQRTVNQLQRSARKGKTSEPTTEDVGSGAEQAAWRNVALQVLSDLPPAAFERLVQRLLRECGFVQVEVTGRAGDGGIDGRGILRLGGLLGFNVIFQCKRWQNPVGASQIRDFRGAMVGRADKALFITTGTFTKEALREATRDGAPTIDLIDGDQLVDKLKEFSLGVQTKKVEVEQVTVAPAWFRGL
jgi:restriction system protein